MLYVYIYIHEYRVWWRTPAVGFPAIRAHFAPQQGREIAPESRISYILPPITHHSMANRFWRAPSPNGAFRATAPAEACPGASICCYMLHQLTRHIAPQHRRKPAQQLPFCITLRAISRHSTGGRLPRLPRSLYFITFYISYIKLRAIAGWIAVVSLRASPI